MTHFAGQPWRSWFWSTMRAMGITHTARCSTPPGMAGRYRRRISYVSLDRRRRHYPVDWKAPRARSGALRADGPSGAARAHSIWAWAARLSVPTFSFFYDARSRRAPEDRYLLSDCFGHLLATTTARARILWILSLLTGYWLLMKLVPVPGYGVGHLGVEDNLAHYVDRIVLGRHNYLSTKTWDPEGIVSTLPPSQQRCSESWRGNYCV